MIHSPSKYGYDHIFSFHVCHLGLISILHSRIILGEISKAGQFSFIHLHYMIKKIDFAITRPIDERFLLMEDSSILVLSR